jgi:hypothetical protein
MKRTTILGLVGFLVVILAFDAVIAQPPGGGGGRGRGGRGGGGVNAGQILGMLAFDAESNLSDEQLVGLRNALQPVYQKQQDLMRSVRSGDRDFQDVREDMMALRGELLEAVSAVLTTAQVERLKTQMQRQANRGGRGGQGGRGGGGGR